MAGRVAIKQRNEKLLMTIDEAAQVLSLSRSVFYALVLTGQIASIKIGRSRRIPAEALRLFIAHHLPGGQE